jgi:hypothetical protein
MTTPIMHLDFQMRSRTISKAMPPRVFVRRSSGMPPPAPRARNCSPTWATSAPRPPRFPGSRRPATCGAASPSGSMRASFHWMHR